MGKPKSPRQSKSAKPAASSESAKLVDRQPFQFRLAGLLSVMTGLAIVTAVATPFMRQWTASHWRYFGLAVLAFGLGALGSVAISRTEMQRRRTNIGRVGTPAIRITSIALYPQSILGRLQASYPRFLLAAIALGVVIYATELHTHAKLTAGALAILAAAGTKTFTAVSWCVTRNEVVLGPTGCLFRSDFYTWNNIRMSADDGCLRMALNNEMKLRLDLTPEELATVEAWQLAAKK